MTGKLNRNQWIAVFVSLAVVVFIFFISARASNNSRLIQNPGEVLRSGNVGSGFNLDRFLIQNNMTSSTSDLVFEDLVVGEGLEATSGDHLVVNYAGFLTDQTQFDSSWDREVPFEFTLGAGEVIVGWDQGIAGMKEGGVRILTIPPSLAYGAEAVGPIPPNSTLIFVVELLRVER